MIKCIYFSYFSASRISFYRGPDPPVICSYTSPTPNQGFHHHAAAPPTTPARPRSPFLPSATAARLPQTTASPLQLVVLHAEGSSSSAGEGAAPSSATARLCRNCKQYYEPSENHDRACRYHTKSYTGDTKRKGDWSANADRVCNGEGVGMGLNEGPSLLFD